MQRSKLKILYIVILLIIAAVEIVTLIREPENVTLLARGGVLIVLYISAISGIERRRKARIEMGYEAQYRDLIGGAFVNDRASRKKLMKAIVLYNENRYDAAVAGLDALRKKCTNPADHIAVLCFRALCFSERKMYKESIRDYEELLRYDRLNSRAWSNLGLSYSNNGQNDLAEDAFRNAIRANDKNAYAYTNLAALFFEEERYEEACKYADKAVQLDPTLKTALHYACLTHACVNDKEGAEQYLQRYTDAGGDRKTLQLMMLSALLNLEEDNR